MAKKPTKEIDITVEGPKDTKPGKLPGNGYAKGGNIPMANHPHFHAMRKGGMC